MPATSFHDLKVWRKAHAVTLAVYGLSEKFPRHEVYGLTAQARAAARSTPANIWEGFVRRTRREKARFCNISEGSLEELRYYLILAVDLKYVADAGGLQRELDEIARMLRSLIRAVLAGIEIDGPLGRSAGVRRESHVPHPQDGRGAEA